MQHNSQWAELLTSTKRVCNALIPHGLGALQSHTISILDAIPLVVEKLIALRRKQILGAVADSVLRTTISISLAFQFCILPIEQCIRRTIYIALIDDIKDNWAERDAQAIKMIHKRLSDGDGIPMAPSMVSPWCWLTDQGVFFRAMRTVLRCDATTGFCVPGSLVNYVESGDSRHSPIVVQSPITNDWVLGH